MTPLPTLVINLARHENRMLTVRERLDASLGATVTINRFEAVDGRTVDMRSYLTVGALQLMERRHEICNHFVLDSPEAVGCFLSHRGCWKRVVDEGWPAALVMEDDACPTPTLRPWLEGHGARLRSHAEEWDFIVVGFQLYPMAALSDRVSEPTEIAGVPLLQPLQGVYHAIFGTHCYLVSRTGAETLLRWSSSIDLPVDHFLLMSAALGLTRGYVAQRRSLCLQCDVTGTTQKWWNWSGSIPHRWWRMNAKVFLPDVTITTVLWILLVLACILIWRRRRTS